MKNRTSLRHRWLIETVSIALAIGLVCGALITVCFASYCYTDMQQDMERRAKNVGTALAGHQDASVDGFSDACAAYAVSYDRGSGVELQYLNVDGELIATSGRPLSGVTADAAEAATYRAVRVFVGTEPETGEWVMSVSAPMIYSNGEIVGVFRYVIPTARLNGKIGIVALVALAMVALVAVTTLVVSSRYVRSILDPLEQIIDKSKRIAGGTYGIQIKTKHNDEIGDLAETINELSAQVARNEKLQTEFISSLSHELRTPLTAITGWSETLLSDESLDTDTQRGVKIISREAKRLTEMVIDLLDFTRMQDGRMTLNMAPSDIRAEFEDTVFMYSSRLALDGIVLDYIENEDDIPEITCDAERLRQVFLNVLDNAAKHGGEGMRIEASIHYSDQTVTVLIRDFGGGIPEDEIPLVKKKFYKGSSKARGSGIGLAVCDEIVAMHGGELELSNAEGGGTVVSIRLPAVQ